MKDTIATMDPKETLTLLMQNVTLHKKLETEFESTDSRSRADQIQAELKAVELEIDRFWRQLEENVEYHA